MKLGSREVGFLVVVSVVTIVVFIVNSKGNKDLTVTMTQGNSGSSTGGKENPDTVFKVEQKNPVSSKVEKERQDQVGTIEQRSPVSTKIEKEKQDQIVTVEQRNPVSSKVEKEKQDQVFKIEQRIPVPSKGGKDPGPYRSCKDVPMSVSGKYNIGGKDILPSFMAYCEQKKYGGGWMVIQHRFNGLLNFERNWTDYRNGFGDVGGEHWLGIERIYQFTNEHRCELLVEMKDFYNNSKYARYDSFGIGSEKDKYHLKTLGKYNGTAGDSLTKHKGLMFSTADRDNDISKANCAKDYHGGWWFEKCYHAFLNGLYQNASGLNKKIIAWDSFSHKHPGLSYSQMLIRPLK